MIALANFSCGKVVKSKGDKISLEEVKLLGGNIEHLISEGCLERLVTEAEAAEIRQELEEPSFIAKIFKKKKGK